MNAQTRIKTLCAAVAAVFGSSAFAAEPAGTTVVSGEITPKLYSFDYFKGADANSTQFLERYNTQKGMGSDSRDGAYLDLDMDIVANDGRRNVFALEWKGFGSRNHRGTLKADSDTLGFTGYYSDYRSTTGGMDYLYSPGVVDAVFGVGTGTAPAYSSLGGAVNTQSGYVGQFNNDSPGQTLFKVDRNSFGMGLVLKPTLLGAKTTAALNYDGYQRDGNRFASYVLGGANITNGGGQDNGTRQRWRGFSKPIDEKMNRYTLNLSGAPGGFVISYEGALEKFDNQAAGLSINDIRAIQPLVNASVNPIHFIPDSTLVTNNLRLARNYGSTTVAAGYGLSVLKADSFSQEQQTKGYNSGKITTNSAYLNVNSNALAGVGLEGFVKYNQRDNDSTYPAVGLIDPATDQTLGVRINSIKTLNYGLAATFRPLRKSTVTVGWKHEDKDRDLAWSTTAIPLVGGIGNAILAQQSTYRENTKSDELYVNLVARPMPGMVLRVTPSYLAASQTGLVTEPEKAFALKTKLTHTAGKGVTTSGYYNYKNRKNANNPITSNTAGVMPASTSVIADLDRTEQAAGVSLNVPVSEWVNTMASLSWMQDDFATYYLRSHRRRFEAPNTAVTFITNDRPEYKIDTYVLTLGGDWQVSDQLRYDGGYAWSQSKGHTASGDIFSALPAIDSTTNGSLHTLTLGVSYQLKKKVTLKGSYAYEYYQDKVYTNLTGGYHALMLGVTLGF